MLPLQNNLTAWLKAFAFRLTSLKVLVMRPFWHIYNILGSFTTKQHGTHIYEHPEFVSMGGSGVVWRVTDAIVVKRCRKDGDEDFAVEKKWFETLNRQPLSPYIVRQFHITEDAIFLDSMSTDLYFVLIDAQTREKGTFRLIQVNKLQDPQDIVRWMWQVAAAAAWLEGRGLVHCDIRPANILLSAARNAKLTDFGRVCEIGEQAYALTEPFARRFGDDCEELRDRYGQAGCRTEQFAIGSVAYTLTRGHQPFENELWGPDRDMICSDRFQRKEFPVLGSNEIFDGIIDDCWHGRYGSIAELSRHLASLDQHWAEVVEPQLSESELRLKKRECEEIIQSGIFEKMQEI
ncbi:hypothetical protein E4U55_007877 [Claviceps digitariae]|nr:hypothetical protein E4U55_007877 [Claviceps digitariae]